MDYKTESKIISEITDMITSEITDIDEYDKAYDKIRTIISEQFKIMTTIIYKHPERIEETIFDTSYMITSEIAEICNIDFTATFEKIEKIITENMN